jgi:hypothetical protein
MQRRIRQVVEERRRSRALPPDRVDPDATIELPTRAVGRVAADQV